MKSQKSIYNSKPILFLHLCFQSLLLILFFLLFIIILFHLPLLFYFIYFSNVFSKYLLLQSLAQALARLVKARQGSRSFQLLLITHDESFVYKLGREGLLDTYLKVRKDSSGRSKLSSATLHV